MSVAAFLSPSSSAGPRPIRWHRPLLALCGAMVVLALFSASAMLVGTRQVTGLDVWAKPFKFAVSTALYAGTLAWLLGQLPRRRLAGVVGWITTIGLTVELAIIVTVAALGQTSHFNVSTPVHAAIWYAMAGFIVLVWSAALIVAVSLMRTPLGDPARTLAIRAGAVLSVVGMGLAFLMTFPPQSDAAAAIGGAHTVGLADGGPGLPLLGWSAVGGDLRIPHFVGMHALQALPVLVLALELLARRLPVLGDPSLRLRLVVIATATYAAVVALVTWQALAGQSIVRPAGAILSAAVAVAALAIGCAVAALLLAHRRATGRPATGATG